MIDKPKTFLGKPPTPQHEAVKNELEAEEQEKIKEIKEEAKQEILEKVIEETENPPKSLEWWIQWILFWGMALIILIQNTIPLLRNIKYTATNNKEIQFTKEKTEMVKALREYREGQIKEIDERIVGAFK